MEEKKLLATTDFALRLLTGLTPLSPLGLIGTWLVCRQRPEWVGAAQKRFAWTLGLIMSGIVAFLVKTGRTGTLSASLCIICLTLMWMETALGLCIGCKIHCWLIHSGLIRQPERYSQPVQEAYALSTRCDRMINTAKHLDQTRRGSS